MRTYTQEEFKNLPIENGYKIGPTGCYTSVTEFDYDCKFGSDSKFGPGCDFDSDCKFGSNCKFGYWCEYGPFCDFGSGCKFGSSCEFGSNCKFGAYSKFDFGCKFGYNFEFGSQCTVEQGKELLTTAEQPIITCYGAGSAGRLTHFFNTEGITVRCGCFVGSLQEFRAKVRRDDPLHETTPSVKTLQYLGMANVAAATFDPSLIE